MRLSQEYQAMALPTMQTSRLHLRPLAEHNRNDVVNLNSDPQTMKYIHCGRPLTQQEAVQDLDDRLLASRLVPGLGYWAAYLGDAFIGWGALAPLRSNGEATLTSKAELGYRISSRFWRQ
ncbi:hypothetical protein V8C35DRAFT_290560 [Trichoderma chlorosporum]